MNSNNDENELLDFSKMSDAKFREYERETRIVKTAKRKCLGGSLEHPCRRTPRKNLHYCGKCERHYDAQYNGIRVIKWIEDDRR